MNKHRSPLNCATIHRHLNTAVELDRLEGGAARDTGATLRRLQEVVVRAGSHLLFALGRRRQHEQVHQTIVSLAEVCLLLAPGRTSIYLQRISSLYFVLLRLLN